MVQAAWFPLHFDHLLFEEGGHFLLLLMCILWLLFFVCGIWFCLQYVCRERTLAGIIKKENVTWLSSCHVLSCLGLPCAVFLLLNAPFPSHVHPSVMFWHFVFSNNLSNFDFGGSHTNAISAFCRLKDKTTNITAMFIWLITPFSQYLEVVTCARSFSFRL